jgi:hypothetical protein
MRWQKIILGIILGAAAGFVGQLTLDHFYWRMPGDASFFKMLCDSGFEKGDSPRKDEADWLVRECMFLWWLQCRGAETVDAMLILSFIGAAAGYTLTGTERKKLANQSAVISSSLCFYLKE